MQSPEAKDDENASRRPRKAVATQGRESSEKGLKSSELVKNSKALEDKAGTEVQLTGTGIGDSTRGGKLTETVNNGKIKLLVKDRLDPSEKYPIEYREAIRKWFLKRK